MGNRSFFSNLGIIFALFLSICETQATSAISYAPYISEWAFTLKESFSKHGLKFDSSDSLESLLSKEILLENFEVSCASLLQRTVKESPPNGGEWSVLTLELALDICASVNPWNTMECSGISGALASYARSIQEYVHSKDSTKGDLRAACLVTSAIIPSRPFLPLKKGLIRAKCEELCSSSLSGAISKIDSGFCSPSIDLCRAADFTLYSSFKSLNDREFGIALAVSILLSEGQFGIRTTLREGCRFVLHLKSNEKLPSDPRAMLDSVIHKEVSDYYRSKLQEVGLIGESRTDDSGTQDTSLRILTEQISRAIRNILDYVPENTATKKDPKMKKSPSAAIVSTFVASSEISPLSEVTEESPITEISGFYGRSDKLLKLSSVQEEWYNSILQSIQNSIDGENDIGLSLIKVIKNIDSSHVYISCVHELRKFRPVSQRKIQEACRRIDPFSSIKCQRLNHFELMFLIKLREELESASKNLIVDLKDLCTLSNRMSFKSFMKHKDEELSDKCIAALKRPNFKGKYQISTRAINKACLRADYIRNSACGDLISSHVSDRIESVLTISSNLFDKKNDKERLQTIRDSDEESPSYIDLCNSIERLHIETIEDCIAELRGSMSRYRNLSSILNVEGACTAAYSEEYLYGNNNHYLGSYANQYYQGQGRILRRQYRDIQYAPDVSNFPWTRRDPSCASLSGITGHIEQEYSESRKGFYRNSKGDVQFHDGFRFRVGGLWYVKIGEDWYIDNSTSLDFVRITPEDHRYRGNPFSFCNSHYNGRFGDNKNKRSFAVYSAPTTSYYSPYQYSYLQDIYGKPGVYPPGQFSYKRCRVCDNHIPFEHRHSMNSDPSRSSITVTEPSKFDVGANAFVTRTTHYDGSTGNLLSEESIYSNEVPILGNNQRTVGTYTGDDLMN